MINQEVNLLEELDSLSQLHSLKRDDIDTMMLDLAKRILPSLKIERINVWLFNQEKSALISIGEYDSRSKIFTKDNILKQNDFPNYFKALEKNKIILAEDIYTHPYTAEFNELYSKPNNICSLLDIPIRISGELIGVMCYEKTGKIKKFTNDEISFCLSVALVLASNLEARKRRVVQEKLEIALNEKDLLMREINHRVKNNLSVLISLMRISKLNVSTPESKNLLEEYEQRIFSMLKIHDMLTKNNQFLNISLSDYIKELIVEFRVTYPQINHCFDVEIAWLDSLISTKKAIHLGLIVSEILLNSIKHASQNTNNYQVIIQLSQIDNKTVVLKIGDSGKGFDFENALNQKTMGIPLIHDLAVSLDLKAIYPTKNYCYYIFEFDINQ
ncbi:MAG: histidine kinase dimerization/phosphoacceptor domain -containing protein [Bacteroidota bacterium]|nr:histidine kinase dimerization/phosphoacceptor domain -containing protein [Bacteroidota bacterium]